MIDRIENLLARIISMLCHPMLIATWSLLILFNMEVFFAAAVPAKARWMIIILVFITTGLLPALTALLMARLGIISSAKMNQREERLWPFVITALFYYLAYYLLKQLDISAIYVVVMLGAFTSVVLALVVSTLWKISVHMIGMGGMTGAFTALSLQLMLDIPLLIVVLIAMSGLTGFARLKLQAHTPLQVLAGYISGFGVFFLLILR
jgi:hypothetical protein